MTAPWEAGPSGAAAAIARQVAAAVPELTTPRLRLRAPRLADFDVYARIATTERGRYIGGPVSRDEAFADFAEMVAGWMLRGHGLWAVERLADGALLGFVPLGYETGDPEAELGFLFLAEAEGQGYAREAAEAARGFAFDRLGWTTVVSFIDPANLRSVRLAERLGARLDPGSSETWRHDAPGRKP
jgi:RimJ/RimL family protein N-acetyltransferase